MKQRPLPSLLRGFSAPVELDYPYAAEDDAFLMMHDSDDFNRWAAAQRLAMQTLLSMLERDAEPNAAVAAAFGQILTDQGLDDALKAEVLMLPSESDIAEACAPADPGAIHRVRESLRCWLASALSDEFESCYHSLSGETGVDATTGINDTAMQQRKLKNVCLGYLAAAKDDSFIALAYEQFEHAKNMTDQYAALAVLADCDCEQRNRALQSFEQQWNEDANVMDKWFAVQAASSLPGTLEHVKSLMVHERFDIRNPNKVRALIGTFAMRNPAIFHARDGSGYAFVAEQVLKLDKMNPQIASRMVRALMNWKRLEPKRSGLMRAELQSVADSHDLSGDVFEIVSKSLC